MTTAHPPPKCARLTEAQRALIETPEALDLVDKIARHFARRDRGKLDDYRSAGQLGLIKAALKSDPDHPGNFLSFAATSVRWAIQHEQRAARPAGFKKADWSDVPTTLSLDLSVDDGPTLAEGVIDHRENHHDIDIDEEPMQANGHATNRTNGFHPAPKERQPEPLPRGVRYDPGSKKWVARITVYGARKHLGSFESIELASAAYEAAYRRTRSHAPKPPEPVKPKGKPGPKPRAKVEAAAGPTPQAGPRPGPVPPVPSGDPVVTAEAILAISKILGPLDAPSRKSILQLAGQICGVN